ncbi:Undecaprenyl pyrophosphate synthetase [Desulfonispora thiosulfatigenes DSM 11270]|uniref:Isoprenyl transferase n=1 Tax=Desulfonispora thiosulfatigenes DSM 11270 TaxID=656914 RepID=A0A1W1VKX4_DESTI|nr:isoprenyl transferase [Desulfonispora thiosulfatigenes]SMB94007.1 Undecaprenyl pyrophosphate synthetase [Desulfonispora thiosulfatigenes DSM 11270]
MRFFGFGSDTKKEQILEKEIPQHIAIIMDGNGRWARNKGLPRSAGHRAGVEALKGIVRFCLDINVKYLTVYAFSTENWKRPQDEIKALMNLIIEYIKNEIKTLKKNGVKINPIGDISGLESKIQESIQYAFDETKENDKLILNVALNYGGRAEITKVIKEIALDVKNDDLLVNDIDEKLIEQYLYTKNQPDPDLIIRPSGEMRISNFLLWQLAYSEIWVTNIMWPDFKPKDLTQAINDYQNRTRRYGAVK